MLTEFGKELRRIRLEKGLLLKDMADAMGITSSYLSAIEFGKRAVPEGFLNLLARKYDLNAEERARLDKFALKKEYKIKANTYEQKELAAGLARRFDSLSTEELEKIRHILEGKGDE